MSVLTNFLPVQELRQKGGTKQEDYIDQLNKLREVVKSFYQNFKVRIDESSLIGKRIIEQESKIYEHF